MTIPNRVYDALRFIAELLIPGLCTLYCALAPVWGLPLAGQIAETVIAVDTFLGLFTAYLRKRYHFSAEPLTDEEEPHE